MGAPGSSFRSKGRRPVMPEQASVMTERRRTERSGPGVGDPAHGRRPFMSTRSSAGMDRRAFLRLAAATATLAVEHNGSSENLGYVDADSHLWSPERSRYPLRPGANEADVQPTGFTPGDFFAHARPEGVNRVVIIGHTAHFGFDATYLTDLLKARPGEIAAQAYL